ncbi:MAG: hypothetical protein ACW98Y_15005 [Candidatus Thorarchaeota archaeon]|jgi:hypothetical protein
MKKSILTLFAIILFSGIYIVPVHAQSTQALTWGVSGENQYKFDYFYWVPSQSMKFDEEFYLEVDTTDLTIPDPLESWESMPFVPSLTTWLNGSEAEEVRVVGMYAWSYVVPIGNWDLMSTITENQTSIPRMELSLGSLTFSTVIEVDDWFKWGFNYSFFSDEWDFEIHVSFTKSDGVLAVFELVAYEHTTGDLFAIITAHRDGTPPFSFHPSDLTIESGSTGNIISWEVYDESTTAYMIFRNGTSVLNGTWSGDAHFVNVSIGELSMGVYEYLAVFTDAGGNYTEDSVIVSVIDSTSPTISSPNDISFDEGTTGHVVTWTADDYNPESFIVHIDGDTRIASGSWDGSPISINLDAMPMGVYTMVITVTDSTGNTVTDEVHLIVNVPPTIVLLGVGTIGVAAALVAVGLKKRGSPYRYSGTYEINY